MKYHLLFLGTVGAQELLVFLLMLAISIGLFLALRALVLWYWKIDKLVTNQEIQNGLLRNLVHSIEKLSDKSGPEKMQ
jgi:hypothetical protein